MLTKLSISFGLSLMLAGGVAHAVMDTWSRPFSRNSNWVVTAEGSTPSSASEVEWCRAIGTFNRHSFTMLANSSAYGRLAFFLKTNKPSDLTAGGNYMRGRETRTCATGKSSDAPAGTLRSNRGTKTVELCDGKRPWHALTEMTSGATVKINGRSVGRGNVRGMVDLVANDKTALYSNGSFPNLTASGATLSRAAHIAIIPDYKVFPAFELDRGEFQPALSDLNRCLPSGAKLY